MTETPAVALALACMVGALLGTIFFGGLWWTVRRALSSEQPALWFIASLLLRLSIVLAGFYLMARGHWDRLLLCLLGFITARFLVMRMTRAGQAHPVSEASLAP